ncbi:hypothetical protein MTR_7g009270 [Medicago truncatula]|uniref:Uncharacterized protein n=1 Tax=Medicago truncatula TaxID=3880 RepID=G7KYT7_MEDTR|nr:hypothetical protein MTR_7g009270 [Medicago truncatula]
MASSSSASGSSSNEQQGEAPAYEIKGRTMSLEEWELNIQSESPVDFDSLAAHDCDIGKYYEKQGLGRYFNLLNGPTYQTLVRHFWVRASIYDREAAKIEEDEKVLLNPELKGKSRAEMGLETFSKTQIRSSIMGIRVWITEDTIAFVIRRPAEGEHEAGISKPKDSPWNAIVNKTLYNKVKDFAYADMNTKTKVMLKIQNENLLPKGGGGDQPSLEHKILLHFVIKGVEANIPRYIFRHMVHQLRESQLNKRSWVPYGRLLSEIFHQGGIIEMLKEAQIFTDEQLGTVRGKIINGETLRAMHLIKAKDVKKSPTDLKPSDAKSDLIPDFPPICKQDPLEVQRAYIMDHYKTYNQKISLKDVPDQMYGGELPVAKSRKSKKKQITKEEYLAENATEVGAQKHKKAKKEKSAMSTILEEVEDLDDVPLIKKRTRSTQETAEQPASEQTASEQAASEKPPSPKRKREAALQTIKRKRSNLTRNLKTAEGRREQMMEELEENWDEDSSPKKAKRTATSEPIVMPSFEMTEEMKQYTREVAASKIAEKKRMKMLYEEERDERLKAAGYVPTPDIAALSSELETVKYGATLLSQALKNKQASGATSSEPASEAPEAVHPEAQSSGNPSNAPTNTQIPSLPSSPSSSSTESDDQPLSQHIDKLLKTKPTKLTDLGTLDWEQTQIEFSKNRIKLCEKFNLPPTHPLYPDNPEPVSVQQPQPNPEPTTNSPHNSTTQKASEVASDATTSETPQHQELSTLHNLEKHLGGEMQPTPTKASKTVPEKTVLETQTETQTISEQTVQEQTASEQVAPDQTTSDQHIPSDQTTEQQQQPDSPTIIDLTPDQPSTSNTTQTEPSPIPDHILESEYIEEQLIRLSDEIQALILRRTVPVPPIHYYDQWMDLQKSFDELLDQLRTKCVSSHSAMLKKLLDDMHEAAKEKELNFVPLLDITPFYPEEEYITRAARIQAGYKRRMREKDELLQKKDDQIKYLLEQLYKQAQP